MTIRTNSLSYSISGVGLVNATGADSGSYLANLGRDEHVTQEFLFGAEYPAVPLHRIPDANINHGFTPRHMKKLDRLTLLSSAAVRQAVEQSDVRQIPADRVGIFVGNALAGWSYVEPQLYPLYAQQDMSAINPYVATAWFPTASQGEITIDLGFTGFSKTFAAENISAAFALRQACWALDSHMVDLAIVCGAEAPLSPLVYNAAVRDGHVTTSGAYRPYDFHGDGGILGEGAAAIAIERTQSAQDRSAPQLATLSMVAVGQDREPTIREALGNASVTGVDYIALEARGIPEQDTEELYAVEGALRGEIPTLGLLPASTGILFGASFAMGITAATLAVAQQVLPGGAHLHAGRGERRYVEHGVPTRSHPIGAALTVGTDPHGQVAAVVVTRVEKST